MASPTLAFHKEFLLALCVSANARGGRRNVLIANLSIETWLIAANCWHLIIFRCGGRWRPSWAPRARSGGLWSAPFGRDLIIFTTWSTIWLYQECESSAPKREEGTLAHWGGRTIIHHLILKTTLFPCWSQSSSQTSTWTTGGDWTRCCRCCCWSTQPCSPDGENFRQPEKGWRPVQKLGKVYFKRRTIHYWIDNPCTQTLFFHLAIIFISAIVQSYCLYHNRQ